MKVIITGSTGMVGQAVLIECLESDQVDSVLLINRTSLNRSHPKLKELLLPDFMDIGSLKEQLTGLDACFYCMGVSALGMSEADYTRITYDTTELFAKVLFDQNPGMTFNYVSGMGTDGTEKGRSMWARVKGKTENRILSMGFRDAYAFRPGLILPEKGVRSKTKWYNTLYVVLSPLMPLLKKISSSSPSSLVGQAMINSVLFKQEKKVLEPKDINQLGRMD
jgi:uncharacterized protein YbjT (DUF2867 family)